MLLGTQGVRVGQVDDLQTPDVDLVAAGRARIGEDGAGHTERGLLGDFPSRLELSGLDVLLSNQNHTLDDPLAAVAKEEKLKLTLVSGVVDPAVEGYLLPDKIRQCRDRRYLGHADGEVGSRFQQGTASRSAGRDDYRVRWTTHQRRPIRRLVSSMARGRATKERADRWKGVISGGREA